ncbi:MAG: FkbM family methyltransferase [Moheibacter sp.]
MNKLRKLKHTIYSINHQILEKKIQFNLAFFSHYILKSIPLFKGTIIKFPVTKFKYQNIILQTRANTIDFWVCIESYEPDLTYFLASVLRTKVGTFIDVGGHIGRYTTLMAKKEWDVITFEPLKTNFDTIKDNLNLNNCKQFVQLNNIGLGNQKSTETIYFNGKELAEASLFSSNERNLTTEIKIERFDDYYISTDKINDLCIVKIDVEGVEENVIRGMSKFIETHKPILIIELWGDKSKNLVPYLKSIGYTRLHIFWFIKEKHQELIDPMYKLYNKHSIQRRYE